MTRPFDIESPVGVHGLLEDFSPVIISNAYTRARAAYRMSGALYTLTHYGPLLTEMIVNKHSYAEKAYDLLSQIQNEVFAGAGLSHKSRFILLNNPKWEDIT